MNGNNTLPENIEMTDPLDRKLIEAFPGRVVRKDLVQKLKVGFSIPVFVLEYLLGKYCSSTDEQEVAEGLKRVKDEISERVVRADQGELIKSRLQRTGSMKIIDMVTVIFDEKDRGGKYWAKLAISGLEKVHIDEAMVYKYERVLTGGVWATVEITYDESMVHGGVTRPFILNKIKPIQIASANLGEFIESRGKFTREEWVDVMLRTIGYEPTHPDFTWRIKMLCLLRLLPMVEKNYNFIELGPKETGKSFVFREISPYVILLSGGQGSVADLFGWKNRKDKPGLVVRYDTVAFDEVAGSHFKNESDKQMYKGYMEQSSFSRGDDKGTISAEGGIVFNGNIEGEIESIARTSHLFIPLPETIRNDTAFHDRWHAYLPGWEMLKLVPDHFTTHLGFIADYIAEIFHNGFRNLNYTDAHEKHFAFGNHVGQRDRKAAVKTISGLIKLIHPDGKFSKKEMKEYVSFALEMRRRVKEQLKRINPIEFSRVNLSYLDNETGDEYVAQCIELGAARLIPEGPLPPGDIFSIGYDPTGDRMALFRIQVAAMPGSGRFQMVGITSKAIKESARMAYEYLRGNAKRIGLEQDIRSYDLNIQVMSPMQGKDTEDLGIAFFVSILSAIVSKNTASSLVVLGKMSIHGVLSRLERFGDCLRVAMDSGAKQVMIPTANASDIGNIPTELLDKIRIDFFSEPKQAAFKAISEA
ncbi:MAG: protease Lon-related BREX system protein BrxL [Candidatus Aminicenantes bacterium]|nr:protease Lon-related BREX system protein BrxL [Candidatus Aminicenantes bacterium]NIM80583.1 protease Lon-related BREX system protein BrxL [Candidatus Aminicenantes bacterium]NIN19964.1 protease Lon-related BREX system protein BrxL [Candidatus Aminicenantes bacterium]NIN42592.1 protease Lon-related BREX system protein BrxL [Candidatus Aminicenantes bacterium]NIN86590.1 protease Lon-related BREX system protein BrxL [Candidatus Aminicenantes bacterium]